VTEASPSPTASSARTASPTPTFGQATVTLSPNSGPPGTKVTIAGSGYPPGQLVDLYLDTPNLYPSAQIDAQGHFLQEMFLPRTTVGNHLLCADAGEGGQQYSVKACAPFSVRPYQPQITLSINSGLPRTHVWMTGNGFSGRIRRYHI
jgi:hypothetical protein